MKGQAGYPLRAAGLSLSGSLGRTHTSEDLGGGGKGAGEFIHLLPAIFGGGLLSQGNSLPGPVSASKKVLRQRHANIGYLQMQILVVSKTKRCTIYKIDNHQGPTV